MKMAVVRVRPCAWSNVSFGYCILLILQVLASVTRIDPFGKYAVKYPRL